MVNLTRTEDVDHGFEVLREAIRGELDALRDPALQVADDRIGRVLTAVTHDPRDHQLRVGIERGPGPDRAETLFALQRGRNVLLLRIAEGPDLIGLHAHGGEVPDDRIMEAEAGFADFAQE